jgi:hypothetical protein
MTLNPLNIWQLRSNMSEEASFREGVDRAMAGAFPPIEGEFPERIARALQALEAAMGEQLSLRPISRCGSGGTSREAAHVHWNMLAPMVDMTDPAFLPHGVRHGLQHPSEGGIRP